MDVAVPQNPGVAAEAAGKAAAPNSVNAEQVQGGGNVESAERAAESAAKRKERDAGAPSPANNGECGASTAKAKVNLAKRKTLLMLRGEKHEEMVKVDTQLKGLVLGTPEYEDALVDALCVQGIDGDYTTLFNEYMKK